MWNTSEKRQVRLTARLASGVATAGLAVGLLAGTAGAAETSPVTDFASYPSALPAGCPGGDASLVGVRFSNGRGDTATDLRKLALRSGDTLTMEWDGAAPGCEGVTVTLTAYATHAAQFDMSSDETLVRHVSWTGGPRTLSLEVPAGTEGICYLQVDAVLGAPLAVIGPNGSYYNSVLRNDGGPNNLISAKNFAADCVEAPAPTTPTTPEAPPAQPPAEPAPVVPVPSPAPEPEVEVEAENPVAPPPVEVETTTPVTETAPLTTPPAVTEVLPATSPTTAPEVEVLGVTATRQAPASLPRTGVAAGLLSLIGTGLLAAGAVARRTSRTLRG